MTLTSIFRQKQTIPVEYRANFRHLYLDIAWFGLVNGSAISFMAIYATRMGATAFQIGLLSAAPALVSLIIALPAGAWLQKRSMTRSVFWMSVLHRIWYGLWIFLPVLLVDELQTWALILLVFIMSVPGTVLAVGFNAMFATAVPPEWRSHVVGIRNALLALVFIVVSLVCGVILQRMPFPLGYQVVFAMGFVGAMMSSLHLYLLRLPEEETDAKRSGRSIGDWARPGTLLSWTHGARDILGLRFLTRSHTRLKPDLHILRSPFGLVMLLLFGFHLAQYLAVPLFPLFWVNNLHLTDAEISLGNAVFYVAVLVGSMQLARISARTTNLRVLVLGILVMSLYPTLTAVSTNLTMFLVTSVVGGVAWSLAGGAISTYLYEKVPDENRPAHMAWYMISLNVAVLLGAMGGPLISDWVGITAALLAFGFARLLAALALLRWG